MTWVHYLAALGTVCILMSAAASARAQVKYPTGEWDGFSNPAKARLSKMRALLGRDQKCKVAVHGSSEALYREVEYEEALSGHVTCVQDVVANEGTLNEQSGCALVSYDLKRARFTAFFNEHFPRAMVPKLCNAGGFEELMAKKGFWSPYAGQDASVEEAIFTGYDASEPWRFVLVYAHSQKLVEWFEQAKKRGETRHAAKVEEFKKEHERKLAAERKEQERERLEEQRVKAKQKAREKQERGRQRKIEEFYE